MVVEVTEEVTRNATEEEETTGAENSEGK